MSKSNVLAFPSETNSGMTLRDYFAAAVLPAVYTVYVNEHSLNFDEIAEDTYQLADAMLFARIKE